MHSEMTDLKTVIVMEVKMGMIVKVKVKAAHLYTTFKNIRLCYLKQFTTFTPQQRIHPTLV